MSPTRYVHNGTSFVQIGGKASDQFPGKLLDDGVATATSVRNTVTCTASATPHASDGAWVEVDASLSAAASGVVIFQTSNTFVAGANSSTLLEIGTGAGGSETVWATVGIGYRTTGTPIFVPGAIAGGTRVAVRLRSARVSPGLTAVYEFLPVKAGVSLGAPVTYRADTATSRGLTITPPASVNTKGAWTEMVASTASVLSVLSVTPQAAESTAMSSTGGLLCDIGVGGSGSEVVVISDIHVVSSTSELYDVRSLFAYGVDIPAGSRIAARYARSNVNNALDLILVGAPPA